MNFLGIIPSRYASTRLPGKPLKKIGNRSMINHVYERAAKSIQDVIVATDCSNIADEVKSFGGNVVLTSENHKSGTDRCAEALRKYSNSKNKSFDVVINIQGDEPFIHSSHLEVIKNAFFYKNTQIATLAKRISSIEELEDPNVPKVILNSNSEAIYFSRSVIPFIRNFENNNRLNHFHFLKHIGLYAYKTNVLNQIVQLPVSPLEAAESLEQLRWIFNNKTILVIETDIESISVDTVEDLEKARAFFRKLYS